MQLSRSLLALATAVQVVVGHNIVLPAHGVECFHESLRTDDQMTVTFQVGDRESGSAGNLDIDFWILAPSGHQLVSETSVSNGDHSFTAHDVGKYQYCFGNQHWGAHTKEVSFNVHGVVYVTADEGEPDPLEKEVRQLAEQLNAVKDEQQYIVIRERTHRNTAESTNSRVKWWNLFIVGVVVGESIFQVWWVRRFFEVKRVV